MSALNERPEICLSFSSSQATPLAYIGSKAVSAAQFHADVDRLLDQFADAGDTLISCPGRYGFGVALLASWIAGKTAVLPPNHLEDTLQEMRSRFNITFECDASWAEQQSALHKITAHEQWQVRIPANLIAVKLFTSGSTGFPKTVAKSMANLIDEVRTVHAQFNWPAKPVVASVPAQHLYGLTFSLLLPWVMEVPWIDETPLYAQDISRTIRAANAGILISIPDQYKALLEDQADCNGLMCLSAASLLPRETAQRWQRRCGQEILEIYGSTETGIIGFRRQLTSEPWEAFPQVRLISNSATLTVQSPFVGYEWQEGFQTADRVTLLEDNRFHLLGRADSMVKIAGKRISLTGIENILTYCPGVNDAAVISVPVNGIIRDKALWAVVAASAEHALSTQIIQAFLQKKLDSVEVPRRILIVDRLPRNSNGKLPRKVLEEMFRLDEKQDV